MAARLDGKQGNKTEKLWRYALLRAVKRRLNGRGSPRMLEIIAARCVKEAADGDMAAMKEIGDRLDGKPVQGVDLGGEVALVRIERVIVDPGAKVSAEVHEAIEAARVVTLEHESD